MTRVFAYLRVSGPSQLDGQGFPRQLDACNNYAYQHDMEIVKVFREEAVPGKTELDNRPALRSLVQELLSDGVDTVLIERLDRLARDLIVQETIIQDLSRKGVIIISTAEPDMCSQDPTRTLIRQILGAFFEYERKMIVAKLADARKRIKTTSGRCEGVKPFGTLPGEEFVLLTIKELKNSGKDTDSIARYLNTNGAKTRSGKPWRGSVIRKILRRKGRVADYAPTEIEK